MLHRLFAVGLVALLTVAACSGDDDDDGGSASETEASTTTVAAAPDWDADALATAEELATAVRDGGIACDEYEVTAYGPIAIDYENKLPLPTGMSSCAGPGGEDFTFEVFEDEVARANFIATKMQLLCTEAAENDLSFPGLPYVEGENWLVEPDEEGTANALAPVVGGEAVYATCPEAAS